MGKQKKISKDFLKDCPKSLFLLQTSLKRNENSKNDQISVEKVKILHNHYLAAIEEVPVANASLKLQ